MRVSTAAPGKMCRAYGARDFFCMPTQRFRAGLSYSAPTGLVERLSARSAFSAGPQTAAPGEKSSHGITDSNKGETDARSGAGAKCRWCETATLLQRDATNC